MNLRNIFFFSIFVFTGFFVNAQTTQHAYTYDDNGNRITRNTSTVYLKAANPQTTTTLPNGLTPEQIAAGATVSTNSVQLSAYPNPATQHITVSVASQQEQPVTVTEARLYATNGSVQATLQNPGSTFSVPLEGLAAGNYILWLKLSNGSIERVQVVKL